MVITHEKIYEKLKSINGVHKHRIDIIDSIGLMSGLSGVALYQFYYSEITNDQANFDFAVEILEKCITKIESGHFSDNFSGGVSGFGWLIDHLESQNFIDINSDDLLSPLDDFLSNKFNAYFNSYNFDFLHGAIGMGIYYCQRFSSSKNYKDRYFDLIVGLIDKLEEGLEKYDHDKLRWKSNIFVDRDYPGYNLSLSHGLTGIIGFLNYAVRKNINDSRLHKMIQDSANYISSFKRESNDDYSFMPNWVNIAGLESRPSRLAWCYGDLGIGIVLLDSAFILNNEQMKNDAIEILINCTKRVSEKSTLVDDAGFCHGSFGIAQIYKNAYEKTKNEDFKKSYNFWIEDGMNRLTHSDGYAGFMKWDGVTGEWRAETSLLEGVTGVGMVLVDYVAQTKNNWDECFLIS